MREGYRDGGSHQAINRNSSRLRISGANFSGVSSAAGHTMRVDIVKTGEAPAVDHFKLGYWVDDPTREGYRRKVFKKIEAENTPNMDFAEIINGDTTTTRFAVWLNAYYTTGEVRGVNSTAIWTSDNPYVSIAMESTPFTNTGPVLESAIATIRYDTTQTHTATFTVDTAESTGTFTMSNIPAP